jgi:hypothetical protein
MKNRALPSGAKRGCITDSAPPPATRTAWPAPTWPAPAAAVVTAAAAAAAAAARLAEQRVAQRHRTVLVHAKLVHRFEQAVSAHRGQE